MIAGVVDSAATFTLVNKCQFTVWPGISSNSGIAPLPTTGFALQSGETRVIDAPSFWGGRFWGRTRCSEDASGKFSCLTGDCGSGKLDCGGSGAAPPTTLAEFTLDGDAGKDFYDVSLVDGYNLPMLIVPKGGSGENCTNTGCITDLMNGACPSELRVSSAGEGVACRSACDALQKDQYCCKGAYGTPDACKPSQYSQAFKSACPHAYSYAYDDKTSTFTCAGADYTITFCPSPNTSQKSASGDDTPDYTSGGGGDSSTPFYGNMVYEGALEANGAEVSVHGHNSVTVTAVILWRLLCHRF